MLERAQGLVRLNPANAIMVRAQNMQYFREKRAQKLASRLKSKQKLDLELYGYPNLKPLPRSERASNISNPQTKAFSALIKAHQGSKLLAGYRVMGIQHLFGSTGTLIHALANSGAGRENVVMMGKTYSQNFEVIESLAEHGIRTISAQFEGAYDIKLSWGGASSGAEKNRKSELRNYLDRIVRLRDISNKSLFDRKKKYLVIDDGGELIELLHQEYPQLHDYVVAVEQTRKGINRIRDYDLKFPVINVAESSAKLKYESPMIGHSLFKTSKTRLDRLAQQGVEVGRKILLIGYGAVGQSAARSFRKQGYEVEVYDHDPQAVSAASRDGFRAFTSLDGVLKRAKIVLSATGTSTLDKNMLARLPDGAILINGASSSSEFLPRIDDLLRYQSNQPSRYQGTFQGRPFKMGGDRKPHFNAPKGQDWVVYQNSGKELLFLNQGNPVNFDGSVDPIPPRYIQLTRGLLYLAALQAVQTKTPGIQPLDDVEKGRTLKDTAQGRWIEAVQRELAERGESLLQPRF